MATVPDALLLCISSPYARRGELWNAYQQHYGREGDPVLVWQADSRTMNPTLPTEVVERAYAEDEARARAEFGAQFRSDVEGFLAIEAVRAVTVPGRLELPPEPSLRYRAFVDPSGGSSDSFTMAIAHERGDGAVLDLVREVRPPFSPEQVVEEFAAELKRYRISRVEGDAYAGEWPREAFSRAGIRYVVAERNRSELYLGLLPQVMSGRVELLDCERLQRQLVRLERRTARSGKDSIDHAPGGHDDLANAVAGVLAPSLALGGKHLLEFYRQENRAAGEREAEDARLRDAPDAAERERLEHAAALRAYQRAHAHVTDIEQARVTGPGLSVTLRTGLWHE
jgi:hypothetical protein